MLTDGTPDSDPEGNPLTVTGFAIDTNGDGTPEAFTAGQTATIAGVGTLTIDANGAYTFTPAANYNGPVPVASYSISDGLGGTDTATLTLGPVSPVNDRAGGHRQRQLVCRSTASASGNVLSDGTPDSDLDGDPLDGHRLHGRRGGGQLHGRPDGDHRRCWHAHDQRRRQLHLHAAAPTTPARCRWPPTPSVTAPPRTVRR